MCNLEYRMYASALNIPAGMQKLQHAQKAHKETLECFEWRDTKQTVIFEPPFEEGTHPEVFAAILGMHVAGKYHKDIRVQVETEDARCHQQFVLVVSTRNSSVSSVQVQWLAIAH